MSAATWTAAWRGTYTVTMPTLSMLSRMVLLPSSSAVVWKLGSLVLE